MSERYLTRLRELLSETHEAVNTKLRPAPGEVALADKGQVAVVAHAVHGLNSAAVDKIVKENESDVEWTSAWMSQKAGKYVEQGINVAPDLRSWLETKLPDVDFVARIFEADVEWIPLSVAERMQRTRPLLKCLKARIDLCYRIACAIESKGKKVSKEILDKMKIRLEKEEAKGQVIVRKEQEKEEAARAREEAARAKEEAARAKAEQKEKLKLEKERKRKEKEDLKLEKESSAKKKQRSARKQADLMNRFLKKRVTPRNPEEPSVARVISLDSPELVVTVSDAPSEVEFVATKFRVQLPEDVSVLSVSCWLKSLIDFDIVSKNLEFLRQPDDSIDLKATLAHLVACGHRNTIAKRKIGAVLQKYRNERTMDRENKAPRFAIRRSDIRGRGKLGPMKIFKHDKDYRPTFYGTLARRSKFISGRRPFAKDTELDYDVDSDLEWEAEAEDGESLSDIEDDKELANEDAELRQLYGSDDESDDDDFLDDAEADNDDDDDDEALPVEAETGGTVAENKNTSVNDDVIDVDSIQPAKKRPAEELKSGNEEQRKKKRRKARAMNQIKVEIIGMDFSDFGTPSPLNCYPITKHVNAAPFVLFDPDEEERKFNAPPPNKNLLTEEGILELAMMVHCTPSMAKAKTVPMFIQWRQMRNAMVPSQAEVTRVIGRIAVREKREKDSKACWYLKDKALEERAAARLASQATLRNQILQLQHLSRTAAAQVNSNGVPGMTSTNEAKATGTNTVPGATLSVLTQLQSSNCTVAPPTHKKVMVAPNPAAPVATAVPAASVASAAPIAPPAAVSLGNTGQTVGSARNAAVAMPALPCARLNNLPGQTGSSTSFARPKKSNVVNSNTEANNSISDVISA